MTCNMNSEQHLYCMLAQGLLTLHLPPLLLLLLLLCSLH
jgi:hypothetical protein